MNAKKYIIIIGLLVFLSLALTISISYGVNYSRATKPLRQFSELIEQGKLNDISLTIYYVSPYNLTPFPQSVDGLIGWLEEQEEKIVIDGNRLGEHIALLKQMSNVALTPVIRKSYVDARIYYVFETEKEGKILDVTMWGGDKEFTVFVNGIEVKNNNYILYDVIMPFLPEDKATELEKFLDRGKHSKSSD